MGSGNPYAVYPQTDPVEGARGNLKVLDGTGGLVIGWAPNLPMGQGVRVRTDSSRCYGFSGSAFEPNDEGWRAMRLVDGGTPRAEVPDRPTDTGNFLARVLLLLCWQMLK